MKAKIKNYKANSTKMNNKKVIMISSCDLIDHRCMHISKI